MADVDEQKNERVDDRVYPGAPSQGAQGDAEVRGGGSEVPRSQVLARAVLAISLVLVVGSGAYFAFRPGAAPEAQRAGSAPVSVDADDATADGESGQSGADQGDGERGSVAADGDAGRADGGTGGPDEGASGQSTGQSGSSGSSSGQDLGKPGASGGSGTAAPDSGSSGQQGASPQAPATISVSVTVDSSSVGGSVSASTTVDLAPSSTAYDALCATGLSVNSRSSAFGVYVAGIGGLSEFDHGGGSGWKYKVNGAFPSHSASAHELRDGDSVVWVYVTG